MKHRLTPLLAALASAALALPCAAALAATSNPKSEASFASPAAVVAETLLSDGSTNTWTQADLVAALGLLNRRYRRDIETEQGRRAWHGAATTQTLMTNDQGQVFMRRAYADGFTFDDVAGRASVQKAASNAVVSVQSLMPRLSSEGMPPRLAALRAKAAAALEPAEVSVVETVEASDAPVAVTFHTRSLFDDYGVVTNAVPDGRTERFVELGEDGTPQYRCVRYDATNGLVRTWTQKARRLVVVAPKAAETNAAGEAALSGSAGALSCAEGASPRSPSPSSSDETAAN